jgi:16S rRNA (adenine1518-N6/adenine1519-N6)-dimethyltransferase
MRRSRRDPLFQKKSLGQVFLTTDWPCVRMVEKIKALKIERVMEIGPGNGVLTRELVAAGLDITAIEKDDRFAEKMTDYARDLPEPARLTIVNEDILKYDWEAWLATSKARTAVVGNIPYNISTPIMLRGLSHFGSLSALMFMTQLEFAARVAARHNTKDYGSLTVFAQLRAEVSLEFQVPRTCFHPVPKVDSAVLLLTPGRERFSEDLLHHVESLTRLAFTQRRKKLRNSIKPFLDGLEESTIPIDLERRADSLTPGEFMALTKFLLAAKKQ